MSNMSYCRFENTTDDLIDCLDAFREAGTVEELKETRSSKTEAQHVDVLIDVCRDIIAEFGIQSRRTLKINNLNELGDK